MVWGFIGTRCGQWTVAKDVFSPSAVVNELEVVGVWEVLAGPPGKFFGPGQISATSDRGAMVFRGSRFIVMMS